MRVAAPTLTAGAIAASAACPSALAFQCHAPHPASSRAASPLSAKKKGGGAGKGFGASSNGGGKKAPKYSLDDKSYNLPPTSPVEPSFEEVQSSMADFFSVHGEWSPLFRHVMSDPTNTPPASSFLSDVQPPEEMWGLSTLERRHPWRLLPSKPTSESSLDLLSTFLDEWQQSLLDIPLDSIITGDNDLHFLEEGRRTIAVTRFHVLDEYHDPEFEGQLDWETELFRTCWSEVAHLSSQDDEGTGSMILLPHHIVGEEQGGGSLDRVRQFAEDKLIRPLRWLGREGEWEIVAMERGSVAVRLLYKLGDIPDLSERDSGSDENVAL